MSLQGLSQLHPEYIFVPYIDGITGCKDCDTCPDRYKNLTSLHCAWLKARIKADGCCIWKENVLIHKKNQETNYGKGWHETPKHQ